MLFTTWKWFWSGHNWNVGLSLLLPGVQLVGAHLEKRWAKKSGRSARRESTSPLFFPRRFPSYMLQLTERLEEARDKLSPLAQAFNQVSSKYGWRYISSLPSADEPQEGRNNCPLLRSCFIGSCHAGVSKRFSCSISLAVYCNLINWHGNACDGDKRI